MTALTEIFRSAAKKIEENAPRDNEIQKNAYTSLCMVVLHGIREQVPWEFADKQDALLVYLDEASHNVDSLTFQSLFFSESTINLYTTYQQETERTKLKSMIGIVGEIYTYLMREIDATWNKK